MNEIFYYSETFEKTCLVRVYPDRTLKMLISYDGESWIEKEDSVINLELLFYNYKLIGAI